MGSDSAAQVSSIVVVHFRVVLLSISENAAVLNDPNMVAVVSVWQCLADGYDIPLSVIDYC